MAFITIDETKCKQDGICSAECPRGIIRQEKGSYPTINPEDEANCLSCGHCIAVCPHGALSLAGVDIDDCPEIRSDLGVSREQAEQFLRSRRSIRVYQDKPIDRDLLNQLVKTASYAPTASNGQTVQWTIHQGRETLEKFSKTTIEWMERVIAAHPDSPAAGYFRPVVNRWAEGYDGILRSANTLVTASAPKANANGLVDCSIALSYLELAALPQGVGTCWAGLLYGAMLAEPELVRAMGLPKGHTWFYPMMIGYPKFKYHRLPERKNPIVHWK